jgi:hypothetical protein
MQKYDAFDGNETETLVNISLSDERFPTTSNLYDIYQYAIISCPAGYGLNFASVRFNIDYGQVFCVRLDKDGIIGSSADIDPSIGIAYKALPESKYIYGNVFFTMKFPQRSSDREPKGVFSSVKQGLVATVVMGDHNEGKYTGYTYTFIGKTKKIFNNERTDVTQTLKDKYTVKCVGLYSEDEGFIEKFYDNNSYVTDQTAINEKMTLEEFYKKIYFDNFSKNKNNTLYPRKDSIKSNNFVTSVIPLKDTGIFDNGYFNIELCVFPGRLKDSAKNDKLDILKSWNGSFFRNHNPSLPFDPYSNNGDGGDNLVSKNELNSQIRFSLRKQIGGTSNEAAWKEYEEAYVKYQIDYANYVAQLNAWNEWKQAKDAYFDEHDGAFRSTWRRIWLESHPEPPRPSTPPVEPIKPE